MNTSSTWLTVADAPEPELASLVSGRVQAQLDSGKLTRPEIEYVRTLPLVLMATAGASPNMLQSHGGKPNLPENRLEILRRLCKLFEVDIAPARISSHRRFLGPLIVAAKTMLFRALRPFLKSFILQQREFNAEVIRLLYEISAERPAQGPQQDIDR